MKLIRDLVDLPEAVRGGAVTIGNFDGVHRGHARIVELLIATARQLGGPAVVLTFDPHPVVLLRPHQAPPPLTWTDRKAELLAELGVDTTIAYPTDRALLSLSPEEFFERIVRELLDARAIVEGPNFYFGHNRAGNVEVLRGLCSAADIPLEIVEPLVIGGDYVSSSRVRQLVGAGGIDEANRLLTHPYRIRGMVRHGVARGATIGFPTANIAAVDTLLPAAGVYACRVPCAGSLWPAAVSVGPNPTFGETEIKVEAYLVGFHGSLYGQPLEVDFLARLRKIERFENAQALKDQIAHDVAATEKIFQQHTP